VLVSRATRLSAALLAAIALAVLVTAACLRPDARGLETHTQLGLWPCGWYLSTGFPCPTCGMTTSFASAAHGRYLGSFATQPFGALLALSTAVAFWAGLHVAMFGSRLGAFADKLLRPRSVVVASVCCALAWLYKVLAVRGL
jgi:hypothetical protein